MKPCVSGAGSLRRPAAGAMLRSRGLRQACRLGMLLLACLLIWDGLTGPQLAPKNLASVLTWVHYRGLLVIALLAAGNFFCYACPMILLRDLGRQLRQPRLLWPARLRNKWIAALLFAAILYFYEVLDLWAEPAWTALLIGGYFASALAVDLLFRNAAFCKYVCPIGQFNFVASTLSPTEVGVRDRRVCARCTTLDCIRGRTEPDSPFRVIQRGCELSLFQPRKVGNLDCTFCLDCLYACPHDNIGIQRRVPGLELCSTAVRSGIGRLSRRPDLAGLFIVFTFGGLINAFGMVSPIYAVRAWLAGTLGIASEAGALALIFLAGLVVIPALLLFGAASASRLLSANPASPAQTVLRFTPALLPLGAAVWCAHYLFHFLTGLFTWIPVAQRALYDLGFEAGARPNWGLGGLPPGRVFPLQFGILLLGLAGSLMVAAEAARSGGELPAHRAALPWALLLILLAGCAIWLLGQPMEMRGGWPGG